MLRKAIFLSLSGLIAGNAAADCTLARGAVTILNLPAQTIAISADAEASTTAPIASAKFTTSPTASAIGYDDCLAGTPAGRKLIGLSEEVTTRLFKTNVPGIGVKVHIYNPSTGSFGYYPIDYSVSFDNGESKGTWDWAAGSYYRVQFYKVDKLTLTDPAGDVVINAGTLGYEWIGSDGVRPVSLFANQIKIVSTPACTVEDTKTIDFGTVTPAMVATGVEKPLDFSLNCKTDYGTYSTTASVTTTTPSTDSTYIKVTDASGNMDNLGIQILNSSGGVMAVNGTVLERIATTASDTAAQFNWKAKLVNVSSGSSRPQNGQFTARAEIVMNIN
ncbi:fimbrial protein [Pantoea sp. BAV 3049]|uniref:fimbrial protein n=1 Tax=Pantoea sp. BAV 3049 TaxID=2654188 RepID=UPI00131DF049|nr:fimbrial protein [Pantoea sp. BAV 3049]